MYHQQYLRMLQNDIPGMAALDEPIKAAEQDIDNLKIGLGEVMGAGIHKVTGLSVDTGSTNNIILNDEEYPPKPSPSPMPQAPPVPEGHPDMDDYEQNEFFQNYDDWKEEVDLIDIENGKKDVPNSLQTITQSDEIKDEWVKDKAKEVLELMNSQGGITGERGTYEFEVDGSSVQIEILNNDTIGKHGGQYTGEQELVWAIISELTGPIGAAADLFTSTAQLLDPDYNPGVILEQGDVRVMFGRTGKSYFFKEGKYLYSVSYGGNDLEWGEYGKQLNEEYRKGSGNWIDLAKSIPLVDLIKALKGADGII
jgi:hypothetical protein